MINWLFDESIAPYCTLGIGGVAKRIAIIDSQEKMREALLVLKQLNLPFFVLGKGSNALIKGKHYEGAVLINKIGGILEKSPGLFEVGAGYSFSLLGAQTAKLGYSGLEFASGIPATVGGAVFMNAGANGSETADSLVQVECLDEDGNLHIFKKDEMQFGYRHSSFQLQKLIITKACFQLVKTECAREKQLKIIDYRLKTQPYKDKSAGCIFKNPSCQSAGALIEQCGLKGRQIGGAKVSKMHANFLINYDGATAEDFLSLIAHVKEEVAKKTGTELETEVRILP